MRGKPAPKRKITPDYKFNSIQIAKLANYLMRGGKKSTALRVIYKAFDYISEKTKQDPLEIYNEAIKNVGPSVELRSKRVGGANYQIPTAVRGERKLALSYRWLLNAARSRKGKPMYEKLALELMDAAQGQGDAVKKKQDVYRMAEANRAFAHFSR
ncbi:MAG: 30S ribosomal protein S7 [Patescibacteria group bacterium]|nr:30S ribosomal protein S7 [Patescibacteria group bacterium]MDD5490187.1 30S ribosomal protein S7 [Patescibacteria group bacterium]